MQLDKFYASLKKTLYTTGVPQSAVTALNDILAYATTENVPLKHLAYMMATAYHEVGPNLVPKRESLNYSVSGLLHTFSRERISKADANRLGRRPGERALDTARQKAIANILYGGEWGRKNLGNTLPDDGWNFRGGGWPQTTGRANYAKVAGLTGIDVVSNPERIVEVHVATAALVDCMVAGAYTGRKLSDYRLPEQYREARAVINADVNVNGTAIARYAVAFQTALEAVGYAPIKITRPSARPVEPKPDAVSTTAKVGWGTLITAGLAAAGYWLIDLPCRYLDLFCGG